MHSKKLSGYHTECIFLVTHIFLYFSKVYDPVNKVVTIGSNFRGTILCGTIEIGVVLKNILPSKLSQSTDLLIILLDL